MPVWKRNSCYVPYFNFEAPRYQTVQKNIYHFYGPTRTGLTKLKMNVIKKS